MTNFRLDKVTAFVAIDDKGAEGIMGAQLGNTFYPLVCGDEKRIAQMYPIAQQIKQATGLMYRVVEFTNRVDVTDEIDEKYKPLYLSNNN